MIFSSFKNPVIEKQTPSGKRIISEKKVKISMKIFKLILFSNYWVLKFLIKDRNFENNFDLS